MDGQDTLVTDNHGAKQTSGGATVAHRSGLLARYKWTNAVGFILRDRLDEPNSPEEEKVVEVLGDTRATGRQKLPSLMASLAHPRGLPAALMVKMGSRHPNEASCTGGQAREVVVWHGGGSAREQQWGILDRGSPGL
jgi:hypothetical protein